MILTLNKSSIADYRKFLAVKSLPVYRITGSQAWFPDEYASRMGIVPQEPIGIDYQPAEFLFEYQRDITRVALAKRKFAAFWDCGLGKTLLILEYAKAVLPTFAGEKGILIVAPPMVCDQTIDEAEKFYGGSLPIERVDSGKLSEWLATCGGKIGITNYEAFRNEPAQGQLGALILDESSSLKSMYGKYAQGCIALGKGLEWKLACTGTPAPNDRIEYANHAVFLDQFPTINAFLARYFINRGQTQERWVLKPHALELFYCALSHWCIFLTNPGIYGWKDNCESIPPIITHIHDVDMTGEQNDAMRAATGQLFACNPGGITGRKTLSKIAKGIDGSSTLKYDFIRELVNQWPDESTIIWCWFNDEQDRIEKEFPGCASIQGSTSHKNRRELLADFKAGRRKVLVSKPDVLGFGLNLQIATRQVFSSLIDSYEQYYQAVKRSNRYGSTKPLNVHIPLLDIERPMAENVLRKATMIQRDTEQQEAIFRAAKDGTVFNWKEAQDALER